MAATPRWKIVKADGEYVASCKHLEDASFLVAALGDGTRVYDGSIKRGCLVWTEGHDGCAGDSADAFRSECAYVVERREDARRGYL